MSNLQTNIIDMEALKIKFDGDTHLIDANTLINSLLHFTSLVQEVNRELASDKKIEIKINANKPGSFVVDLLIYSSNTIHNVIDMVFNKDNVAYAANVVVIVGSLYGFAQFLKGKKPKSIETKGDTITITNNYGDTTIIEKRVYNIYVENKIVRDSIAREFETLELDNNVTGFEILDKEDKKLVDIPRTEFIGLSSYESVQDSPLENYKIDTVVLNIVTLTFEHRKRWEFVYEGHKINAKITDEKFIERIDKGEKFAKGDQLRAKILIQQEFDQPANAYINKSYEIQEVIEHIPRSEQSKIDFNSKK